MLRKFKIIYKKFFKIKVFVIEEFTLPRAMKKFYKIFPHTKILLIDEVKE